LNYVILEKANKVKTLAVDFDGTIVKANKVSPLKTKLLPGVKKGMEQFKKDGWTLIIYTARPNNELKEIKEFLKKNDIPFDYINENPLQPQPNPGKLYCDVMLDDKVVTFKNWDSAYNDVINQRKKLDKVRPKEKKVLERYG
jgi:hydroxymethylpyrimidine pyrophosphatase-like HAD family hydrolase